MEAQTITARTQSQVEVGQTRRRDDGQHPVPMGHHHLQVDHVGVQLEMGGGEWMGSVYGSVYLSLSAFG